MTHSPNRALAAVAACLLLAACSARGEVAPAPEPRLADSTIAGTLVPPVDSLRHDPAPPLEVAEGEAVYYADRFDGRPTASGTIFSNSEMLAAHRTYPFGTVVRVTNLVNGRSVIVRIVDRGPFGTSAAARSRIIDLSRTAAAQLDFIPSGHTRVRLEVLHWGS
jgi:rare lipoprotein A